MPSDRSRAGARTARRGAEGALTLGVAGAVAAALLPVLHVVDYGLWFLGALVLISAVLVAGFVARRLRLPAVAVSLAEALVWVLLLTGMFFRDTALLWVIPTPMTFGELPEVITAAANEIALGAAPLAAGTELSFMIVAATGLLTLIIDHVVLTARMPLLAAVGLVAVSLIPTIAVPSGFDVIAFILLATSILFLLRRETRSRRDVPGAAPAARPGMGAAAFGIGAIAIVVALAVTPLLPAPVPQTGGSVIAGPGINATLQLGDDLRQPFESEVITLHTDAPTAPYLRVTTLTEFSGDVWQPDRMRSVPLDSPVGLSTLEVDADVKQIPYTTAVAVQELASPWLPIPFPAVGAEGMDGEWEVVPYNRTIVSRSSSTQGQEYTVTADVPRPTLEQIRATDAVPGDLREDTAVIPDDLPANIAELATEVTAETDTDYDALIALQQWFRSSEFAYSLESPVEDGFDGSGADAVSQFLDVREGYCVHFASAFALMARTLEMPSRIVVGYLPGTSTNESIDSQTVYSVSSSQLHAWPEVYFEDIGWIPFEPTNSLGVPTRFASAATTGPDGEELTPSASPTASASTSASARPDEQRPDDPSGTATGSGGANALPIIATVLGIIIALLIPGAIRLIRRARLLAAARSGDAAAAWLLTQESAIDAGIDVPGGESPRAFGARLATEHGVSPAHADTLVRGIEQASYAPDGVLSAAQGAQMADAAAGVRGELLAAASIPNRVLAAILPRSIVVKPGSAYAETSTRASAR